MVTNMNRALKLQGLTALIGLAIAVAALVLAACGGDNERSVTVYSGRSSELIGPILERFEEQSGIAVEVRYASTAEFVATLLEEGGRTPADVFIAQDAGALGVLEASGAFATLDDCLLARVSEAFRSRSGGWVGLSGRARVVVYNTERIDPATLPGSILAYTDPQWRGRIGWAPENASFRTFVTAMRLTLGEEATRAWLEGIQANEPIEYPKNTPIVAAAAAGEIDVGFVNHYYLHRFLAEQGDGFGARNFYTAPGDVGTLINVAGAAILDASDDQEDAAALLDFLLSPEAQRYFATQTFEYPLIEGVEAHADLRSIAELQPLDLDLSRLEDLEGTIALLRETGVIK